MKLLIIKILLLTKIKEVLVKNSNGKSAIKYMLLFGVLFIANGAWAKDLFVAPTGNDSVAYASNSITSPWATPAKAWYNAQAGDTVYFRAGTYNISTQINTASGGYNGTSSAPIIFKNYNNEVVTFTSTLTSPFNIGKNYNYVEGIICDGLGVGGAGWWRIGYDTSATNFKATRLTARNLGTYTDNAGFVIFYYSNSNNGIVEYCNIPGHSKGDQHNVSGIIIFRSRGIKIRNNEISNFPQGIYYKHSNTLADTGIEIYGNYIHDCGSVQSVSNYANWHDNLFANQGLVFGVDGGTGDGGVGGNYNTIQHNTFYNCALSFSNESASQYNIVKDNIFMQKCSWHQYTSGNTTSLYTNSDYNLYVSGNIIRELGTDYTLASWRSHAGTDAHSLSGTPTFVGGSAPSAIAGYALAAGSLGKNVASDGKDMGANISLVGVNPSGSVSTISPMAQIAPANPAGLTVR